MLQPKNLYSSKSKKQQLIEKKEQKFGNNVTKGKVMIVKPIQLDDDNSDQDSKVFRTFIVHGDKQSLGSLESGKKQSFNSSEKELSPKKFNQFDYSKLHKKPASINLDDENQNSDGIQVVEDTDGIDTVERDSFRQFKFFVEGSKQEKNVKKFVLKDRLKASISEAKRLREEKKNNEQKKALEATNLEDKEEESDNESIEENGNRYFNVSRRYFNYIDERCYRCGKQGHFAKNCLQEWSQKCKFCFSHQHDDRSCPQMCYKCGIAGHVSRDCQEKSQIKCQNCKKRGHQTQYCGGIIRQDINFNMNNLKQFFNESDLKKLKCIASHGDSEKKCNKFNCFQYKKSFNYPYQNLRTKSRKIQRVNLQDYQYSEQKKSYRFDNSFSNDRNSNFKFSNQKQGALDYYRQRYRELQFLDSKNSRGREQNRSFDQGRVQRKQHHSHKQSDRRRQYYY